jgi:type I restriction enzyme M protein
MWNQPFEQDILVQTIPMTAFALKGGITNGKGDWAWLQHTFSCLNEHGRAAVDA